MDKTIMGSMSAFAAMLASIHASLPDVVAVLSGIAGAALAITGAMLKYAQYRKTMAEAKKIEQDEDNET